MNFQLKYHFNWSFSELDMMMPWERELYVFQLKQAEEDKARAAREAALRG